MCHYKWYVNMPKKRSLVVGRAPGEQRSAAGRGAAARGPRLMSLSSSSSAVPEKPRRKKDTVLTMLAGGIAGAIEAVATWPVEYIKTQQQQPRKIVVRGGIVSAPQPYKGIVEGLQFNIKTAGFFSVYTGLTPTLILSIPKSSCRFGANAYFRDQLRSADGTLYAGASFVAGLLAGIAEAVLVVTPQETIKTKLISLNMGFQSGVRLIVEREGVAGLYQGGLSTAFKQGGSVSVRFLFMSEYTRWLKGSAEAKLSPAESFLGGVGSGLVASFATQPFDVVKTRMQSTGRKPYTTTLQCFRYIVREEGAKVLFSGIVARCARVVPGSGIIFMSAEVIYNQLDAWKTRSAAVVRSLSNRLM